MELVFNEISFLPFANNGRSEGTVYQYAEAV